MRRSTLMMIASATLLLAAPSEMIQEQKKGAMSASAKEMTQKRKMVKKKRMNSPFLIKHGLPHMTKMVMAHMDDPAFGLSVDQREKLTEVRKQTMGTIREIKPKVMRLRKEIIQASTSGAGADSLKEKVEKLASLEAKATMVHLRCIENTKKILTKDQLLFLLANKTKMKKHGTKKGMGQSKKMMKCAQGRCGSR